MIEFDGVHLTYPSPAGPIDALGGIDLCLHDGEMLAVLGENGSGKSTLVRLANGLLRPDRGRVLVDGIDAADPTRTFDVRSSVGVVFQDPDNQIVATSVEEEVAFGPENLGLPRDQLRERVDAALEAVGLRGLERREPHLLSGGQKQRLTIAGALAMRPRHLILDEPTSMLDPKGRREVATIVGTLRDEGIAIALITHHIEEAAIADRVAVLQSGVVAFLGTFAELVDDSAVLAHLGLEMPPVVQLVGYLRGAGVDVPGDAVEPSEIVGALCL